MRILILLKGNNCYKKENQILLRHLEEWSKSGNEIFVLGNKNEKNNTSSFLNYIERPSYLVNDLLLSLWLSLVNHPEFDLIIKDFSAIPFLYKKAVLVNYLSEERPLGKLKFAYSKNNYYLATSRQQYAGLLKMGILNARIFVLESSLSLTKVRKSSVKKFKKNILFIESKGFSENYLTAIKVFKEIARRDEGWRFSMIISKDHIKNAEVLLKEAEIDNGSYFFKNKLDEADIVLDLDADSYSLKNDIIAMVNKIPVITYKSDYFRGVPGFEKCVILTEEKDSQKLARTALDFAKNPVLDNRVSRNIENFTSRYSWKNLSQESFEFLESI